MKHDKKKRILITGAAGFIGSHLARRALVENYELHAFIKSSTNTWRITDLLPKIKVHNIDLKDAAGLRTVLKEVSPAIIIHCAVANVYSGISASERELFETNFWGTINLIQAAQDINYQCFINTGTSSEYGFKDKPIKESDLCEPNIQHGIFKLGATLYSQLIACSFNKPIVTLRLFSPYGPYDDKRRFTTLAILNAIQNKDLKLSKPTFARDYIYIDDVVDLYFECIEKAQQYSGQIFNVGMGRQSTLKDIVETINKLTGTKTNISWNAFKAFSYDTDFWQADMTKTFNHFSWRPRYNLESGLKKFIEWMRQNIYLYPS